MKYKCTGIRFTEKGTFLESKDWCGIPIELCYETKTDANDYGKKEIVRKHEKLLSRFK